MVQVQSTWFPLVDRNPQTFVDIYEAKEADFQKATQRVSRSKDRPSLVRLGVMAELRGLAKHVARLPTPRSSSFATAGSSRASCAGSSSSTSRTW